MLQISRVTAFTVSELSRENQQWGVEGGINPPPPLPSPSLGLKNKYLTVTVLELKTLDTTGKSNILFTYVCLA